MIFGAVGLLFILGSLVFVYALCKVAAQSEVIAKAIWAAQFSKQPPEGEDV